MSQYYTSKFFKSLDVHSLQSANEIVPILKEFIEPKSIIDIGCGTGAWLSVFQDLGIEDVLGADGSWVPRNLLAIPQEKFLQHDLLTPLKLNRRFDLAISVEVAEHLPDDHAESFVEALTQLAAVVVFSAAIPFQGGNHHINEQWQSYWASLFQKRGYIPLDCIRPIIWDNSKISFFYRQNILLYVHQNHLVDVPHLQKIHQQFAAKQINLVHPEFLSGMGIGTLMKLFPQALARSIYARINRMI